MGGPSSPYTRKMLAVMRFRNIPYRFERQSRLLSGGSNPHYPQRAEPKVHLLPTFYFENEAGEEVAVTDSSPIIRRLEKEYEERSIVPSDPVLAFLNMLLEDFGDEWLTKAMFHYRWSFDADIRKAGDILPLHGMVSVSEKQAKAVGDLVRERQIARLSYVGSNEATRPTIEESFKRIIALLDEHFIEFPFLMGERPGSSDFALYGQLTCLALFDPTPQKYVLEHHPRVYAWVESLEDLSGYLVTDEDWLNSDGLPQTLIDIFNEVGRIYVPYLIGNAKAVIEGAEKVQMTLDGRPWEQKPFPYQVKCLRWLRDEYANLEEADRKRIEDILAGTGCEALLDTTN
jgi:glutathione S-transferase